MIRRIRPEHWDVLSIALRETSVGIPVELPEDLSTTKVSNGYVIVVRDATLWKLSIDKVCEKTGGQQDSGNEVYDEWHD